LISYCLAERFSIPGIAHRATEFLPRTAAVKDLTHLAY
jgi:hypothetical protein